ncbi:MAG TPA: DNA polymerase III subunit beta [Kiritimatiellia bacterium]|nr:DNA polymerase III subunit beta [Kiritimatiellia bacterium]
MKLTVNKDAVLEGLQKVQSIVSTRSTLPVLYNVYLKAEKDRLWLTSTDLEVTVRTSVDAKVARTGGTTLPARRVFSIFKELPVNEIEIDVDDKDVASIRAGASFFKILGISEDEFPPLPKFQGNRTYSLEQKLFKNMLQSVHYAASTDETRPMLNGVLLSFKGGKLNVVATDGRRMAMWEQDLEVSRELEGEWIVPTKTVNELLKTLKDEGDVRIQVSENQISFEHDSLLVISKLVDHTYPNFRQVIPQGTDERISLERELVFNAVRRVALLLNDRSNSITLHFTKDHLEISAVASDIGEGKEKVAIKYRGKDITVAFNPDFLMDPLRNLSGDEVGFELSDELSPCLIRNDKPFLYVLMPMRVK